MSRTRSQLLRDYSLYLAITAMVLGTTIWLMVDSKPNSDAPGRFLACALSGIVTFFLFIRSGKPLWKRTFFWGTVAFLLVLHCVCFVVTPIPKQIGGFAVFLFLAIELALFNAVRVTLFR